MKKVYLFLFCIGIAVTENNVSGQSGVFEKSTYHADPSLVCAPEDDAKPPSIIRRIPVIAVRTNLLSDQIFVPNIGFEALFGCRFSGAADFTHGYWRLKNRFAVQTMQINLEGRYWLANNAELNGWNIGIYATIGGRYNIQWQGGWQGDRFWSAGFTGGYSMHLSGRFNLDLSLGAGFFYTPEARAYTRPQEGHLIWRETRYNVGRFSLTKARMSLVWLIPTLKQSAR